MREIHLALTGNVRRTAPFLEESRFVDHPKTSFCGAQVPQGAVGVVTPHDEPLLCRSCIQALPGTRSQYAPGFHVQPLMWKAESISAAAE
jgi:hypothetical protein